MNDRFSRTFDQARISVDASVRAKEALVSNANKNGVKTPGNVLKNQAGYSTALYTAEGLTHKVLNSMLGAFTTHFPPLKAIIRSFLEIIRLDFVRRKLRVQCSYHSSLTALTLQSMRTSPMKQEVVLRYLRNCNVISSEHHPLKLYGST